MNKQRRPTAPELATVTSIEPSDNPLNLIDRINLEMRLRVPSVMPVADQSDEVLRAEAAIRYDRIKEDLEVLGEIAIELEGRE